MAGSYPGYEYRQQLLITHFDLPPGIEPGTPFSPTDDFASLIYGRSFASGGPELARPALGLLVVISEGVTTCRKITTGGEGRNRTGLHTRALHPKLGCVFTIPPLPINTPAFRSFFVRRFLSFSVRDQRLPPCRVSSHHPGATRPFLKAGGGNPTPTGKARIYRLPASYWQPEGRCLPLAG